MILGRDEARKYGKRSAPARRRSVTWRIGDEHVTAPDIAARLGVDRTTALRRLKHAQAQPGPVTWASLGLTE